MSFDSFLLFLSLINATWSLSCYVTQLNYIINTYLIGSLVCLQETLTSSHLLLRRAAVACLRQLAQREAREVCEYALTLANEIKYAGKDKAFITETGLEGALFSLLDTETDRKLISDVQDTLVSMLQSLAADNLTRWLFLIKDVLQATAGKESYKRTQTFI